MVRKSRKSARALKGTYLALVLAFLYLPIMVMFALSFNASESRAEWTGFTFDWYIKLFQNESIISALKVTIFVAVIATIVSVIIGWLLYRERLPLRSYLAMAAAVVGIVLLSL